MPLILDTHYVYALAGVSAKFRKRERAFLSAPDDELMVSAVSIWEIALKWRARYKSGARKGPAAPGGVLAMLEGQSLTNLPLSAAHAATALTHALPHRDPFDELLLAQAQAEGAQLLTRDAKMAGHPLARTLD